MRSNLVINLTDNANHGKKLNRLLDLCIKIDDSVDKICKNADERKYKMFGGNHCIQTAACIKHILDEKFGTVNCTTHIIYGIMTDNECIEHQIYNHAYVYMEYKGYSYIIDVSRKTREALLCCTQDSSYAYGQNSTLSIPEYDDIRIIQISKLDYDEILKEKREFFTQKSSWELFSKVKFLCQKKIDSFKKW